MKINIYLLDICVFILVNAWVSVRSKESFDKFLLDLGAAFPFWMIGMSLLNNLAKR